ncbi:hypothetical protein LMG7974_00201 [Campylobacter majalis]|uniref:Cytochrome c domain-containing protein n=1 Tax=Campylobacter majalis TaxID=2790656 RepID=A0ABN7K3E7_9BACT|nr:cytochrome c [Campylobacter majalis]CAD7287019.1 hypothetical protein LMG7974_00201 [Campylobacter majalis]
MRLVLFLFFLIYFGFGADFITKTEYAKMLYKNPRGIGCNLCHGEKAEGKIISKYLQKDRKTKQNLQKELVTPPINNISLDRFKQALSNPKSVMPSYFLTDEEILILYEYIRNFEKRTNNE